MLTGRRFQSLAGVVHTPFSAVPLQHDLTAPAPVFPTITRALTPVTKEASSQMVPFGEQPEASSAGGAMRAQSPEVDTARLL